MEAPTGEVRVGAKPTMNYVLATVIQFNQGAKNVVLKARGRAILKAINAAQITVNRFLRDQVEIKDVKIGSEVVGEPDKPRNISTIEILLERK
ncbi:MAG: DNA-binding protein Alba [Thermoprotei archaeon]|nr:MAG: DNA-binding protein Alba [Thermoprotei archaeon]RLE90268.1 MAG: DNA-binding protein Alba [Thermoprotei archaeon]